MKGYNDKMAILVKQVLERIKALAIDPQRLTIIKEKVCGQLFSSGFP